MKKINKKRFIKTLIKSDDFNEYEVLEFIVIVIMVIVGISLADAFSTGKIKWIWTVDIEDKQIIKEKKNERITKINNT